MNREVHVRFSEGPAVRFRWATQLSRIRDNPELDIECLVKLHESIDVVVDLVKAAFHAGESILHILYNHDNRSVVRLE